MFFFLMQVKKNKHQFLGQEGGCNTAFFNNLYFANCEKLYLGGMFCQFLFILKKTVNIGILAHF